MTTVLLNDEVGTLKFCFFGMKTYRSSKSGKAPRLYATSSFVGAKFMPKVEKEKSAPKTPAEEPKKLTQSILSLGGMKKKAIVTCAECGMVYANGDEEDEKVHLKKHNMKAQGVDTKIHPFFDSVAGHFQSYSCNVQVNINSIKDIIGHVSSELGYDYEIHPKDRIFMKIVQKKCVSVIVARPVTNETIKFAETRDSSFPTQLPTTTKVLQPSTPKKQRTIPSFFSPSPNPSSPETVTSSSSQPLSTPTPPPASSYDIKTNEEAAARAAVLMMWTALNERRKGHLSSLLTYLRESIIFGNTIQLDDIAFSAPTQSGLLLVQSVTRNCTVKVIDES